MAYITPTNPKWVTWYDVSQALQERTGDYTQSSTQYATKAYIIANFDTINLDKLNTTNNSIGISYLDSQFVKWADVEKVEYIFYIDTVGNTSQIINKEYYTYNQTFIIYSYKNTYKNGALITSNIPVAWHYNSSQTGWVSNTPTGGTASATTVTIGIPENKLTSQVEFNWNAIQNTGLLSGANTISIKFQQKAKYGNISWNPPSNISISSTGTTTNKGILVTGNFNDNIPDSQGTDAANILTAVTITSSETWVTGITFSLTSSNYNFPVWTSETISRVTTIILNINDPRLVLNGTPTFMITQEKINVTFDTYVLRIVSDSTNSFGNFTCTGGSRNYTVHSYANMYYDGILQGVVNIPYNWTPLSWATINNTSMETFRSIYNATNGSGKGTVTIDENLSEGNTRSGNVFFSQGTYSSTSVNVSVSQDKPCMVYYFDIAPTSVTLPGSTSGTSNVTVTSYKVKNGNTANPIPVGYSTSTGSAWLTVTGNTTPSTTATTNSITYTQNPSTSRNGIITYTQVEVNENGVKYNKQLNVNQEDGFINVYKFSINGTEGSSSNPIVNLSEFSYTGGTQTISLKSYAEVHIGSASGVIDHYIAVNWDSDVSCNWLSNTPISGSGINTPTGNTVVSTTAAALAESDIDNSRCCDISFTQATSGNKITVHGCQEKNQTGYTYTFTNTVNSLSFEACSSSSKTSTITSYKEEVLNGVVTPGSKTNVGYDVDSVTWASATTTSAPTTSATTTTITVDSNSNNVNSRNGRFVYTQKESIKILTIDISQNGATCAKYSTDQLKINIGDGFTTTINKNVVSGSTNIVVNFESPELRSLCGISTNNKCPNGVEPYKVESKPTWISSAIGDTWSTTLDTLSIGMSDVASERTGTVVYTNGTNTASITITQAAGESYTYRFIVNNTSSSKVNPNHETSGTLSFSNIGESKTFNVVSDRTNSVNGVTEAVSWSAETVSSSPYVTFTSGGTGNTNNVSVSMSENTNALVRSSTIRYTQNLTNYCVDVPLTQNAAILDCYLNVTHNAQVDFGVSGGTITFNIDSYNTVNGNQGGNSSWTASATGCGTLNKTSGPGGNASSSSNQTTLTVPSGLTACNGVVTINNACGQLDTISYSRSAESYTYYFEVKNQSSVTSTLPAPSASTTNVANTGSTFTIPVKSYRVRGSDGGIEAVGWTAIGSVDITYDISGTGTTSTGGIENSSIKVNENLSNAQSYNIRFKQNSSDYLVDTPIYQNASTFSCAFDISDTSYNVGVNGGSIKINVISYSITNDHIITDIDWIANHTGCGSISKTGGTGDGSFTLTIPSGTTSCNGSVTVTNDCSGTPKIIYFERSAETYTYYLEVQNKVATGNTVPPATATEIIIANIGSTLTTPVKSYRVRGSDGGIEAVGWTASLVTGDTNEITYKTTGTGTTSISGVENASITVDENETVTRKFVIRFDQNSSNYKVDLPLNQNASTNTCVFDISKTSYNFGVSGGSVKIDVTSHSVLNGHSIIDLSWTAVNSGCGTITPSGGTGDGSFTLTMPSGTTSCTGSIAVLNTCTGSSKNLSYSRSAETYTYYFEAQDKKSTGSTVPPATAIPIIVVNSGSTFTIPVKSYRVRGSDGGIEAVSWAASLGIGDTNEITYKTSGIGTTSLTNVENALTKVNENMGNERSFTLNFIQHISDYKVDTPINQNKAVVICNFDISRTSYNVDVNGGSVEVIVTSNTVTNDHITENMVWNAVNSGCGTIDPRVGLGSGSFTLTIPSGTTACNGTVTVKNTCNQTGEILSYSRSGGDVRWSDPAENSTKSVNADAITFTAYANTTGLTASQCKVTFDPNTILSVSELQGTTTGIKAISVDITVPANTSTDSRSWDVIIEPK